MPVFRIEVIVLPYKMRFLEHRIVDGVELDEYYLVAQQQALHRWKQYIHYFEVVAVSEHCTEAKFMRSRNMTRLRKNGPGYISEI